MTAIVRGPRCLLPTAYCSLLTAHCLLLTAYCLQPAPLRDSTRTQLSFPRLARRGPNDHARYAGTANPDFSPRDWKGGALGPPLHGHQGYFKSRPLEQLGRTHRAEFRTAATRRRFPSPQLVKVNLEALASQRLKKRRRVAALQKFAPHARGEKFGLTLCSSAYGGEGHQRKSKRKMQNSNSGGHGTRMRLVD